MTPSSGIKITGGPDEKCVNEDEDFHGIPFAGKFQTQIFFS